MNNVSTNNQDVACIRLPAIFSVLNHLCGRDKGVSVATIEYELLRLDNVTRGRVRFYKPTMLPAVSDIDNGDGTRRRTEITEDDLDQENSSLEDCIIIPLRYFDHTIHTAPSTDFHTIIVPYSKTQCLSRPFFDLVVERETPWQKKFLDEHPLGKRIVEEDIFLSPTDRADDNLFEKHTNLIRKLVAYHAPDISVIYDSDSPMGSVIPFDDSGRAPGFDRYEMSIDEFHNGIEQSSWVNMSKNTIKNWYAYKKAKAATRATDTGVENVESNLPDGLDLDAENLDEYESEGIDDVSLLGDDPAEEFDEEVYEEAIRRAQVRRIDEPTPSELDDEDAQFRADAEAEDEMQHQFIDDMAGIG
jgi:hypothetical protein